MNSDTSSMFETSEMLASFVASTPLLADAWRLCSHANSAAPGGFVAEVVGSVGYLAFSGVQVVGGPEPNAGCGTMVRLDVARDGLFSALKTQGAAEEEEGEDRPVMVHAGFLQLFLEFYRNPNFQNQMSLLLEKSSNCSSRSIVVAGHSTGAAAAALTSLWLLCRFHPSPIPLLCITFGSPLLGNAALSRAVLRERWSGSFCHIISKHDLIPRLHFAPPSPHLHSLLHLSHSGPTTVPDAEFFSLVLSCAEKSAEEEGGWPERFAPFGTYVFCSEEGGICLDNGPSVVKMMHLLLSSSSPRGSVEDHFKYGDYVGRLSLQFLTRRKGLDLQMRGGGECSSYDAGVSLALRSSGIGGHEMVILGGGGARECLEMARKSGSTRNVNIARLAIRLAKISPNKAQIEWYKSFCDDSEEQLGYYDTFRQMRTAKREHTVNMCRVSLAAFWNGVIAMWERNELPHDFDRMAKWIYAANSYKLLVEPLDIADYYRTDKYRERGHYIDHGRERRYKIFDWWLMVKEARRKTKGGGSRKRDGFAGLTQDSCFWARVEEAREWLEVAARNETDPVKLGMALERIVGFEKYAAGLIERKEVSRDVLAANSSYRKWLEGWRALRLRFSAPHMAAIPSRDLV